MIISLGAITALRKTTFFLLFYLHSGLHIVKTMKSRQRNIIQQHGGLSNIFSRCIYHSLSSAKVLVILGALKFGYFLSCCHFKPLMKVLNNQTTDFNTL